MSKNRYKPANVQNFSHKLRTNLFICYFCKNVYRSVMKHRISWVFVIVCIFSFVSGAQEKNSVVSTVVAKARFSRNDFFLYYPLPDHSFRQVEGSNEVIYYTGSEEELFLSRNDGEEMLFPMTYGDRLYFSAKGEFGGYDLFCRKWDTALGEWGEPENMGNPYSSEGDDFLFMETADGLFDIFASNRACSPDSVYVYVLDKSEKVEEASRLISNIQSVSMVNGVSVSGKTETWAEKYQSILEKERELSAIMEEASDSEKSAYQAELEKIEEERAKVEEHIISDNNRTRAISEEVDREVVRVDGSFIFLKRNIGKPIKVTYIND